MPTIDYSKLLWTPFGNSPTNTFDRNNAPLPGLTSRSVQTLRVDQNGNPIIPAAPGAIQPQSAADARSEQNLTRQNMWFTSQAPGGPSPAPQRSMVPNNWGTSVGRTFDPIWENNDPGAIMTAASPNANDIIRDIPGPQPSRPSQSYVDAANPIDMFKQFGIMPSAPQNPALGAIDDLTGSGRSTGSPFPLPSFRSPIYSAPIDITVNGGAQMPPMPQARPNMPPVPFPSRPNTPYMDSPSYLTTPGMPAEITIRGGSRSAPAPLPRPAFTNPSATYFDRSTGSFVTGRQPPPLPKRPSAETKARLKAQQNGGNQSPKPAGYGSKGYSAAGRALQALYGN